MTSKPSLPARAGSLKGELAGLQRRYRHELMEVDERLDLRERIIRLKKKAGRS